MKADLVLTGAEIKVSTHPNKYVFIHIIEPTGIVLSPEEARLLANILCVAATEAEMKA